jgi:hypothetical protein
MGLCRFDEGKSLLSSIGPMILHLRPRINPVAVQATAGAFSQSGEGR